MTWKTIDSIANTIIENALTAGVTKADEYILHTLTPWELMYVFGTVSEYEQTLTKNCNHLIITIDQYEKESEQIRKLLELIDNILQEVINKCPESV